MPFKPVQRLAGVSPEAERQLLELINGLGAEVNRLSKASQVTGLKSGGVLAQEGQVLRVKGGTNVTLPRARPENQGAEISVLLETAGELSVTALESTVNGDSRFTTSTLGKYSWTSNGSGGWLGTTVGASETAASTSTASIPTWSQTLARGRQSGSSSPIIDPLQFLGFGDPSAQPTTGDIRSDGDLELQAAVGQQVKAGPALIAGDPGTEESGIDVGGITFESVLKASDIGGTLQAQFIVHRHSTALEPIMVMSRSNSDDSSHALVTAGQGLGTIYAAGHDGTNYAFGGFIAFLIDGTPGNNDMPTRLVFATTADGAGAPTERFRINNAGAWGIGGATFGSAGQYFRSAGSAAQPTWANIDISEVSGTFALTDGDKGHVVVSSNGTVWLLDPLVDVAGQQTINTTLDLLLQAGSSTGGVRIHAGLTPFTTATDNRVTITADDQVVLEPTGSCRIFTGGTERLEVESTGAWQLNSTVGGAGTYIRSGGAGAPPTWATIAVGEVSGIVATTGAVSIPAGGGASLFAGIRDNGAAENDRQNLNFLSTTSIVAAVADDSINNELELTWQRAALTGAVAASQNSNATVFSGIRNNSVATTDRTNLNFLNSTHINAVLIDDAGADEIEIGYVLQTNGAFSWTGNHTWSADDISFSNVNVFGVTSTSTALLDAVGDTTVSSDGNVVLQGGGFVLVTNNSTDGFLVFEAATASTPTLAANRGMLWVNDPGANPTELMFTDDSNVDQRVLTEENAGWKTVVVRTSNASATNATTNLSFGAHSINPNTAQVGSIYRFSGFFVFDHTAAATPTLTLELLVNSVVVESVVSTPVSSAGTFSGWATGHIVIRTTGAAGTMMCDCGIISHVGSSIFQQLNSSAATATDAIDTTLSRTIEMRIRMTTAVASNTLTVTRGIVEQCL